MAITKTFKQISLAMGFYPQALWLSRVVRRDLFFSLRADIEFYSSLLPPGALCFDVGANIGTKSEAMLISGAHVVAFEPNPLVLPELRANCGRFENFLLVESALGSNSDIATLYVRKGLGQSGLRKDWEGKIVSSYNVPVVTLDSAIRQFGIPFYCKIDVEGWELEVLKGLTNPIPLISFEFHFNDTDINKTILCLDLLSKFGSGQVNITPPEESTFLFDDWMPLDKFIQEFPNRMAQLSRGKYGDIYVRHVHK